MGDGTREERRRIAAEAMTVMQAFLTTRDPATLRTVRKASAAFGTAALGRKETKAYREALQQLRSANKLLTRADQTGADVAG